jgi:hypothetical protein
MSYTTQDTLVGAMHVGPTMHEFHQCVLSCVRIVHLGYVKIIF